MALLSLWACFAKGLKVCHMKNLRLLWPFPLIAVLTACGGTGSSAPAPTNFQVTAQDAQMYMTWDATSGVQYDVFCDPNQTTINSHTTGSSTPSGRIYFYGIQSGTFYATGVDTRGWQTGISNGIPYACTVNGRINNGPGGPDATPQVTTPRFAGASWTSGANTALSGMTLKSVAYGLFNTQSTTSDQFVAVGAVSTQNTQGAIAVSSAVNADALLSWGAPSAVTSSQPSNLNAVVFYPYTGGYRFVAVGAQGNVAYALNAATWNWTWVTNATGSQDMNAVAAAGGSAVVAVGNLGAIAYSSDGASWTAATSVGSTNHLRSVVYAAPSVNGVTSPYWIAVGDGGAILKSTDSAHTWSLITSGSNNLQSVAALSTTNTATNTVTYKLVAVGDAGTVLVSANDGASWTSVSGLSGSFVSVSAGQGQFMAMNSTGNVYTSPDGSSWTLRSNSSTGLSAGSTIIRYTPSITAVSGGWMAFDSAGNERLSK